MIRNDREMKEAIFAKHPELRVMVPTKMCGYPAMHPIIGVAIMDVMAVDPPWIVLVFDDDLREEARVYLATYQPSRVRSDDPRAVLCLVFLQ